MTNDKDIGWNGKWDSQPTQTEAMRVTDEMVERARECAKEHTDEDIDWREILTAALEVTNG